MKILYSQIKQLIPKLKVSPQKIGEVLTMVGFMMDGFEEVVYQNKKDYLISLEVRQNRSDCLSVMGLAREIAAYYGLDLKLPVASTQSFGKEKLKIGVNAKKYVKRILAVKIRGLKNRESPRWLKEFLNFYDINSVNCLVDLSNYVMITTGYPSHLFDENKINSNLSWSLNKNFGEITTLEGLKVRLPENKVLIIQDKKKILALAGIVGGEAAKIDLDTKSIVLEMAIYERVIIRQNSRALKIVTEASRRLEKDLTPNNLDFAMRLLVSLILKNCGGTIVTRLFNYYPIKHIPPIIKLNPRLPGIYAGIEIPTSRTEGILKRLRFKVRKETNNLLVVPPPDRMDILIEEDVIEEVVRMVGYNKIPPNDLPQFKIVNNITPRVIYLVEKIRDILSTLGFDEILSLPLTTKEMNLLTNYRKWEIVSTQNSVNEEFPDLRQSIATGLVVQAKEYLKKNIEYIKIFEIGKIFGKEGNIYREYESLGILSYNFSDKRLILEFKKIIETLLRLIGFDDISYLSSKNIPRIANPYSCWDILIKNKKIGILYKLKPQNIKDIKESVYFSEINLSELEGLLKDYHFNPVVELTQKLVTLDANIKLRKDRSINEYLEEVKKKIGGNNIWSIKVHDIFPLREKDKMRYTIRVSYKGLSDKEAKKIHLGAFNLISKK